jgi:hypothetical protein
MYRNPDLIKNNEVMKLLKTQHTGGTQFELKDYAKMSQPELLAVLEKIARKTKEKIDYPPYALTSDNLLKMVLIVSNFFYFYFLYI